MHRNTKRTDPAAVHAKVPEVAEVLPVLYLRGLSTNDFRPALESLLGEKASGLSATAIKRLTAQWETEHKSWKERDLSDRDYVYVRADGIHLSIRLEEDRLCLLVIVGVRPDGTKELIAVEDGYWESTDSWSSVLRSLRDRGMQAPLLAVGDGALGVSGAQCGMYGPRRESNGVSFTSWATFWTNCRSGFSPKRNVCSARS